VLLSNGTYTDIFRITPGDRLINMYGEPVSVTRLKKKYKVDPSQLFSIRHTDFYHPLTGLSGSKAFVGDLNSSSPSTLTARGYAYLLQQNFKQGPRHGKSKLGWKALGDLKQDSFLLPRNIKWEIPGPFSIDLRNFGTSERDLARYKLEIIPDYELGYMLGFYLGDGHAKVQKSGYSSQQGAVSWYLTLHEEKESVKLRNAIKHSTGVMASDTLKLKRGMRVINFYSLQWARLLLPCLKKTEKHLHRSFWCEDLEYQKGLLDGLIDSDGHWGQDGRISFKNTSIALSELSGILFKKIYGSFPSFTKEPATAGGLKNVTLENLSDSYRTRLNKTHEKRLFGNWQAVKKVETKEKLPSKSSTLYGLEIDCPTQSYVANNLIVSAVS
jgi:hypothetical protein